MFRSGPGMDDGGTHRLRSGTGMQGRNGHAGSGLACRVGADRRFMRPGSGQEHRGRQGRKARSVQETGNRTRAEKLLIGLEFSTGAAALASGVLLAARPGGSFLHSGPHVLDRTPFRDWRLPGLLLAAGCGGGFLAAGALQRLRHPAAPLISAAAGAALVGLEIWEAAVIEFQPLGALYAGIGGAVTALALRSSREAKTGCS